MIPWLQIDTARVPDADVELRLMRRGAEFSMMLGPNELMNSRLSGSEQALATLACATFSSRNSSKNSLMRSRPLRTCAIGQV